MNNNQAGHSRLVVIFGDLAQMGEHLLCKQEVSGSNPLVSIVLSRHLRTDVRATSAHDTR